MATRMNSNKDLDWKKPAMLVIDSKGASLAEIMDMLNAAITDLPYDLCLFNISTSLYKAIKKHDAKMLKPLMVRLYESKDYGVFGETDFGDQSL